MGLRDRPRKPLGADASESGVGAGKIAEEVRLRPSRGTHLLRAEPPETCPSR